MCICVLYEGGGGASDAPVPGRTRRPQHVPLVPPAVGGRPEPPNSRRRHRHQAPPAAPRRLVLHLCCPHQGTRPFDMTLSLPTELCKALIVQ